MVSVRRCRGALHVHHRGESGLLARSVQLLHSRRGARHDARASPCLLRLHVPDRHDFGLGAASRRQAGGATADPTATTGSNGVAPEVRRVGGHSAVYLPDCGVGACVASIRVTPSSGAMAKTSPTGLMLSRVAIVVASIVFTLPFCRWLCPLAAVLNPFLARRAHPHQARRELLYVQCGECAGACPMAIPVDELDAGHLGPLPLLPAVRRRMPRTYGRVGRMGTAGTDGTTLVERRARHRFAIACTSAAVVAAYFFPVPSFVTIRGLEPASIATTELMVDGVTCRGSANQLKYFLERDDLFELSGLSEAGGVAGAGYSPRARQLRSVAVRRARSQAGDHRAVLRFFG